MCFLELAEGLTATYPSPIHDDAASNSEVVWGVVQQVAQLRRSARTVPLGPPES